MNERGVENRGQRPGGFQRIAEVPVGTAVRVYPSRGSVAYGVPWSHAEDVVRRVIPTRQENNPVVETEKGRWGAGTPVLVVKRP